MKKRYIAYAILVFSCSLGFLLWMGPDSPQEIDFIQKLALAIAPTILTICAGWFNNVLDALEKNNERRDIQIIALRALLRNELVRMHREYVEDKSCITLEALEYVRQTYDAYHALGGNGTGTKLYNDMLALKIVK